MSTWEIPSFADLEQAALAIVSTHEKPDAVDIIVLDETDLSPLGSRIEASAGNTPVLDLRGTHKDLVALTYEDLAVVSGAMLKSMRRGLFRRISRREKLQMLAAAVATGRLKATGLAGEVQSLVSQLVARRHNTQ